MSLVLKRVNNEVLFFDNMRMHDTVGPNVPLAVERCGLTFRDPDYYVERNRYKNTVYCVYVFEYVYSGVGYIECCGVKTKVTASDYYILSNNASHKYYSDKNDPIKKIWINLRGKFIASLIDIYLSNAPVIVAHNMSPEPFEKLREILQDASPSEEVYDQVARVITDIVLRMHTSFSTVAEGKNHAVRAKRIIDNDKTYSLTVQELGEMMDLEPSYIGKLFHNEFGITPKQYIINSKIDVAKRLLLNKDCNIKEISKILNFSSVHHFTSAFTAQTGCSPARYRNQKLEEENGKN